MSNVDALRAAGCLHESHDFAADEIERIESLSEVEVRALISAKEKLGHELCTKKDESSGTHPDTIPI